jgi:hypothetical protein
VAHTCLLKRIQRKAVKKFTRNAQREVKDLYNKTHVQDAAYKVTIDIKRQLSDQKERTTKLANSIENRHRIQVKQFIKAGERRAKDTKALLEIQCKGLSDEQKNSATKECNSKIGHYQVCGLQS